MPATTVATSAADLHDPTSAAFKKARRQYLKTTRNRTEHVEAEWTPFRAAEKKFKARFPPPDLSSVLDLTLLDDFRAEEVSDGVWKGRPDAVQCEEIELRPRGRSSGIRKAYIFPNTPGGTLAVWYTGCTCSFYMFSGVLCNRTCSSALIRAAGRTETPCAVGTMRSGSPSKRDQPGRPLHPS